MFGAVEHAERAEAIVKEAASWGLYLNRLVYGPRYRHEDERAVKYADIVDLLIGVTEGWKFLGSGSSRMALLGPDGYVYKVSMDGSGWQNNQEVNAYAKGGHVTAPGFRMAATYRLTDTVNVAEYVIGTPWEMADRTRRSNEWAKWLKALAKVGVYSSDAYGDNVLKTEDGEVVVVDLGLFD